PRPFRRDRHREPLPRAPDAARRHRAGARLSHRRRAAREGRRGDLPLLHGRRRHRPHPDTRAGAVALAAQPRARRALSRVPTKGKMLMNLLEDGSYLVDAARLEALVQAMLEKVEVPAPDAALVAGSLVSADARGMNSHGVLRLPVYIRRLQQGGFKPASRGTVVKETAATMLIDGGEGLGAVLTSHAMDIAIEKARQTEIGRAPCRGRGG